MEAKVSDPVLVPALEAHLRRMGCETEVIGPDLLRVEIPEVPYREAAELELDLYLRIWEVTMPSGRAQRVA